MSISPPSDIVFDVAQAADATKARAAASRLAKSDPAADAEFTRALAAEATSQPTGTGLPPTGAPPGASRSANTASPYREFEAMALASFIQSAMPDNEEAVFGSGTAGQVWKSMLAQQIGEQLARAGGIGIAKQIELAHPEGSAATPKTAASWLDPNAGALLPSLRLNSNAEG